MLNNGLIGAICREVQLFNVDIVQRNCRCSLAVLVRALNQATP